MYISSDKSAHDSKKSILLTPHRIVSRPDNLEGEPAEITAHVSIPPDGGWGWVVVVAGFFIYFILDGTAYTFGSTIEDMSRDLKISYAALAIINSVSVALYFCAAPIASALINRYGFRVTTMTGSILCSISFLCTYFVKDYIVIVLLSGVLAGFGYACINMGASLVVGFYFDKHRPIAFALSTTGSGVGVMVSYPFNEYFCSKAGWRSTFLMHAGLFGLIYYLAFTFRPILKVLVLKEDTTRFVTYLPNLSRISTKSRIYPTDKSEPDKIEARTTERLFSAVSNVNFPTAAGICKDDTVNLEDPAGPSTKAVPSTITLKTIDPQTAPSRRSLKQVQSRIDRSNMMVRSQTNNSFILTMPENTRKNSSQGCCGSCFETHEHEERPLYRDDAFYTGKLENLPAYHKNVETIPEEERTGLEYRMAVTRAHVAHDLFERQGVYTLALRRVLATMIDLEILKKGSFKLLSLSSFFIYTGFLVPYMYLDERSRLLSISKTYYSWFVSVLGACGVVGRMVIGMLSVKCDPVILFSFSAIVGGVGTVVSNYLTHVVMQFIYCSVYGFFISGMVVCRTLIIVSLYGIEHLTNAVGMILLFQGVASLISTPAAGFISSKFGMSTAFTVAGSVVALGGLVSLIIPHARKREKLKENNANQRANLTVN